MFRILYLYHLALWKYFFVLRFKDRAFDASADTFFGHQTFRFPKKATRDYFIFPKILKRILVAQCKKQDVFRAAADSGNAVFDSDDSSTALRITYVERQDRIKVSVLIGREKLLQSVGFPLSVFTVLFLMFSAPAVFLISALSNNKLRIALWMLNLVEALNLFALLRKYRIKHLYFFNTHENDANLLAYALMKHGVYVSKIPSEVPLQFWNKALVANSLNLCFGYQKDEFEAFKSTMFVDVVKYWIPETGFQMERHYAGKEYPGNKNIGFYSSGMWLRAKKGRIDLKDNAAVNETHLFNLLNEFVIQHPEYKLIVFLHPIEKAEYELTREHYAQFPGDIQLADKNINNNEQFYNADVAVTLYSTLSYERIFWGYKTLIYPIGHSNFPIPGSAFNHVIIRKDEELGVKLLKALQQDKNTFFENNAIGNYTYSNYNVFLEAV